MTRWNLRAAFVIEICEFSKSSDRYLLGRRHLRTKNHEPIIPRKKFHILRARRCHKATLIKDIKDLDTVKKCKACFDLNIIKHFSMHYYSVESRSSTSMFILQRVELKPPSKSHILVSSYIFHQIRLNRIGKERSRRPIINKKLKAWPKKLIEAKLR